MARILGVDFGLRRLGFAVSDPGEIIATPLCVKEVRSKAEALEAVATVCAEQEAEKVVIGLPLNMNGTAGPMAEKVRSFRDELAQIIHVSLDLWDERLTSKSAEDVLIQAGTRRARRKQVIDKLAAQIMLQNYLDARAPDDAWSMVDG